VIPVEYRHELVDFEDPRVMPQAVISRFLNNVRRKADWHLNIVQNFHHSITSSQINTVVGYFASFRNFMFIDTNRSDDKVTSQLYFYCERAKEVIQEDAVVKVVYDTFSEGYRIESICIMSSKTWRVKRTIYRMPV